MKKVGWFEYLLTYISFTKPNSPQGRRIRIDHLMKSAHLSYDEAAAFVYGRDTLLGRWLDDNEIADAARITKLIEGHKLVLRNTEDAK
jgi:hypothetical protein